MTKDDNEESNRNTTNKKRKFVAGKGSDDGGDAIIKNGVTLTKLQKTTGSKNGSSSNTNNDDTSSASPFRTYTLADIRARIKQLIGRVPEIPASNFHKEKEGDDDGGEKEEEEENTKKEEKLDTIELKKWANRLQVVLEELGLLVCCVSTATYRWGTDRSGAADQILALLNEELNNTQDQIASRVTPRLRNVLTPVVDLVVERTVTTKTTQRKNKTKMVDSNGDDKEEYETIEVRQNHFTRHLEDPDFLYLCYEILARNSIMMRQVVLSNLHKAIQCLSDYMSAHEKDGQHHRNFAY